MATLSRVRAVWQNWPGAPGYSTFYFDGNDSGRAAAVQIFFDAVKAYLPIGLTVSVQGEGDIINDTDGHITGSWSETTPAVVTGTASGAYSGPSGAVIHWLTGGVIGTRRVRGRTFLVPLANAFESNGTIGSTPLTTLGSAANGLITNPNNSLMVWVRPGPKGNGSSHIVSSARLPDLAVVMRSRRI